MAREASDLTKAIRNLCDETSGAITHAQSRVRLKEMGFEIVADPGEKSDDLQLFERTCGEFEIDDPKNPDHVAELHEAVRNKLGWTPHKLRAIHREIEARRLFHNERNNFDVTKYNWKQSRPTPSRKPVVPSSTPNGKSRVAAQTARKVVAEKPEPEVVKTKPRPKHAPAQAAADQYALGLEALKQVKAMGGIGAVQKKLEAGKVKQADLEAQAATVAEQNAGLEAMLEAVATLSKELSEAA